MSSKPAAAPPSPERIMMMMNAYQQSEVLKGAVELGLFSEIGAGKLGADDLARKCGADARGMAVLCDTLTVMGLLDKTDGAYRLTGDSAVFLDRKSPAYLGGMTEFLLAPELVSSWSDVAGLVRNGGPEGEANVAPEHPIWVKFARGMAAMMAMPAKMLARVVASGGSPTLVLDIAAGHGLFGIEVAKLSPKCRVTALDWPQVLEVARENAMSAGVAERWTALPGSAFDVPFGENYDVILLTNFLHHFDTATCEALLRKVHKALAPGGRAVTLEFVPNEDGVSPPPAAMFSMVMLASTPKGRAYRFSEYRAMHKAAGYGSCELIELSPTPQRVVIGYKA